MLLVFLILLISVLRARRLGWCGRVRRAASCVGSIARLGLPGAGDRGGPGKTWSACVIYDAYDYMQPGWCQPIRQAFMENECEALPGVAYPGVWDNHSTINTKTGYDDMMMIQNVTDRHTCGWVREVLPVQYGATPYGTGKLGDMDVTLSHFILIAHYYN